jgi:acetolactate synthase regulatory subunit
MGTTTQLLEVRLARAGEGLTRVLTVLRRRQCQVTSIDFVAPDRHYGGRLLIGLTAPPAHAHCVPAWLENLVEVRSVRQARPAAGTTVAAPAGSRRQDTSALLFPAS